MILVELNIFKKVKFENGDNLLDLSRNETGTYIIKLTATSNGKFKLFKLVKE